MHARHTPSPVLDLTLFRLHTFRASMIGGFVFRIGIGALPFLLPLMLQLGFGMTPFSSGLITFTSAFGAMGMKMAAATILRRFGFRTILVVNCLVSAVFLAACAAFTKTTPVAAMVALLLVGGFFRSLQFTCINTIAYAEIEPAQVSRATSLITVSRQLALSAGVAFGALVVELVVHFRGGPVGRWWRPTLPGFPGCGGCFGAFFAVFCGASRRRRGRTVRTADAEVWPNPPTAGRWPFIKVPN